MSDIDNSNSEKGLPEGSKSPIEVLIDINDKALDFEETLKTTEGILIDFFRGAFWVPCKEHLEKINNNISEFQKRNVIFIAIASDSKNHLKELSNKFNYQFPLVSDRGARIAKKFNVYTFGSAIDIIYLKTKLAIPSTFMINKEMNIIWRYIGTREDRPSIELLSSKMNEKL